MTGQEIWRLAVFLPLWNRHLGIVSDVEFFVQALNGQWTRGQCDQQVGEIDWAEVLRGSSLS